MEYLNLNSCVLFIIVVICFELNLGRVGALYTTLDIQDDVEKPWHNSKETMQIYDSFSLEFLQNSSDIAPNVTLDLHDELIPKEFEISTFQSKCFEYYNSSLEFIGGGGGGESDSCGHTHSHLTSFDVEVETKGIWASCQKSCWNATNYPSIKYTNRQIEFEGLRSLKLTYFVSGTAVLRLTVQGTCYEHSMKQNLSSLCTYIGIGNERERWRHSTFVVKNETNNFRDFNLELITESANDLVLLDKVEATNYLLPPDEENYPASASTFANSNVFFCTFSSVLLSYISFFKGISVE